jgi:hypothetical protein
MPSNEGGKVKEIMPGVWDWSTVHEKWGITIHSLFLSELGGGVLVDPRVPAEGLEWFGAHGEPAHAILTNRHHYRDAARFREAFGTAVHCHSAGMHEFTQGEEVEPFEHADMLAGGIEAMEVGALCPEETALIVPAAGGVLALGDSVVQEDGALSFVGVHHMGDDPEGVKRGLRAALARILERDFRHVTFAHGDPIVDVGRERLRSFVEGA